MQLVLNTAHRTPHTAQSYSLYLTATVWRGFGLYLAILVFSSLQTLNFMSGVTSLMKTGAPLGLAQGAQFMLQVFKRLGRLLPATDFGERTAWLRQK